jgi:hypothetical protein
MVRCELWSKPESPHNRHDLALIPPQRAASSPASGDALAQAMKRGHAMMISQPALICLNATWRRLMRQAIGDVEPAAVEALQVQDPVRAGVIQDGADVAADQSLMAVAVGGDEGLAPAARKEEQASSDAVDASTPLAANERRARAAALRAMALGRDRRFDAARAAFAEAAGLDPLLDLTRTPAFWKLERAAHEAAIDAYLQAGRDRDAAVLRARVQSTFRPKPVRSRPQVMLSP